jgi:hypothetical protein
LPVKLRGSRLASAKISAPPSTRIDVNAIGDTVPLNIISLANGLMPPHNIAAISIARCPGHAAGSLLSIVVILGYFS